MCMLVSCRGVLWLEKSINLRFVGVKMKHYDIVVIGCGGLGSAACYWSARAGASVLGIEQFALGHHRGGSQDHSRIIRLAQHEPAYAALAPHAYDAWQTLEADADLGTAHQVLHKTGGLVIEDVAVRDSAKTGKRNIAGYQEALTAQGVDFEVLNADEVMARWPQFRLAGSEKAVYQKDSGLVDAARGNALHVAMARAHGADFWQETPVLSVRPQGDGVVVETPDATVSAGRAIVASGAWSNAVLCDVGINLPLTVTQEQVTFYATRYVRDFAPSRFPVFMWHGAHNFYGFPAYGEVATKLGQHMGGHEVTAETRDFQADPVRQQRYRDFLEQHIPGFVGPELYTKTCLYTIPPDQHFVLDAVPGAEQVITAIGAGHAYKFASLIGRILSELATDGSSHYPTTTFRFDRPALTDPNFAKAFHA